ncbi:MAG TPA: DUF6221 family protein [Micromonospora sp.]|nr:DUF6221 family protein [Micromonospora sp.]
MDELVRWLGQQLDEEAEAAQRAFSGQADPENGWGVYRPEWQQHTTITPHVGVIHEAVQADHVVRWNPARVLREIDAKRRIIAEHRQAQPRWCVACDVPGDYQGREFGCTTLRLLALPYSDRPGYRPEWRP